MKTNLFITSIAMYIGASISVAEPLSSEAIDLSPMQMDSVVAGASGYVETSGSGDSDFFAYVSSETIALAGENGAGAAGYSVAVALGRIADADASASSDGAFYSVEINVSSGNGWVEFEGSGAASIDW